MKELRKFCYALKPTHYEIHCDICQGSNTHWSEFEGLIWCYDCEKDTRGTGGIFDGPIPIGASELLGITFDKIEIKTGKLFKMVRTESMVDWIPV